MTKQEFLSELRQRLNRVDEASRNEVCADIEGHFIEGKAQGFSEEEICRNLGQPSVIAEQLMEEYAEYIKANPAAPGQQESSDSSHPYTQSRPGTATGDDSFDASVQHLTKSITAAAQSAAGLASSFVGGFFSGSGKLMSTFDIDLDRSFTGVRNINVRLASNNLTIRPAAEQSDAVRVTINGSSKHNLFRVEVQDGELVIIEEVPWFRLEMLLPWVKLDTVVYIPAGFAGNITAKVSNGDTKIYEVKGNQLDVKNSTRNTELERCSFNTVIANASAGKVTARQINAGSIRLRSSAGNADIEDSRGELDIHSSAGNIRVIRHEGRFIKANAAAGTIFIEESAAEIDAHSSAGTVDIRCEKFILPNVRAESSAGSVKIYAAESNGMKLNSAAGTVRMNVGRLVGDANLSTSAGSVHAEIGEINGNVLAKSSMGNVKIKLPNPANCRIETSSRMGGVRNNVTQTENSPYSVRAESHMGSVVIDAM